MPTQHEKIRVLKIWLETKQSLDEAIDYEVVKASRDHEEKDVQENGLDVSPRTN